MILHTIRWFYVSSSNEKGKKGLHWFRVLMQNDQFEIQWTVSKSDQTHTQQKNVLLFFKRRNLIFSIFLFFLVLWVCVCPFFEGDAVMNTIYNGTLSLFLCRKFLNWWLPTILLSYWGGGGAVRDCSYCCISIGVGGCCVLRCAYRHWRSLWCGWLVFVARDKKWLTYAWIESSRATPTPFRTIHALPFLSISFFLRCRSNGSHKTFYYENVTHWMALTVK